MHPAERKRPQREGLRADEPARVVVPAWYEPARLRTPERPEQPGAVASKRAALPAAHPAALHARLPMTGLVHPLPAGRIAEEEPDHPQLAGEVAQTARVRFLA